LIPEIFPKEKDRGGGGGEQKFQGRGGRDQPTRTLSPVKIIWL